MWDTATILAWPTSVCVLSSSSNIDKEHISPLTATEAAYSLILTINILSHLSARLARARQPNNNNNYLDNDEQRN